MTCTIRALPLLTPQMFLASEKLPRDPEKHNRPPLPHIFDVRKVGNTTWKVAGSSPEVHYLSEP